MKLYRFSSYTNALRQKLNHIDLMTNHGQKFVNTDANNILQLFKQHIQLQGFNQEIMQTLMYLINFYKKKDMSIDSAFQTLNKQLLRCSKKDITDEEIIQYLELCTSVKNNSRDIIENFIQNININALDPNQSLRILKCLADLQHLKQTSLIYDLIYKCKNDIQENDLNNYIYSLILTCQDRQLLFTLYREQEQKFLLQTSSLSQITSTLILRNFYPGYEPLLRIETENQKTQNYIIKEKSHLQKEVQILIMMTKMAYETEKLINNLYYADFYLNDRNIILEVNGPHHYVYEDQVFKGRHVYREMVLKSLGFDVRNLSYIQYYKTKGVTQRLFLLKETIKRS